MGQMTPKIPSLSNPSISEGCRSEALLCLICTLRQEISALCCGRCGTEEQVALVIQELQ